MGDAGVEGELDEVDAEEDALGEGVALTVTVTVTLWLEGVATARGMERVEVSLATGEENEPDMPFSLREGIDSKGQYDLILWFGKDKRT